MRQQKLRKQINLTIMLQVLCCYILRKLIRDTSKKTIFSCNNICYEQIDSFSMGGSLGPGD